MTDELVAAFCDVTGASAETAREALAAAGNDLTEAVANHFATQEAAAAQSTGGAAAAAAAAAAQASAPAPAPDASKPQGPFSSTDPWDHTASSSSGPTRGGPTGFRNPAAGMANVFGSGAGSSARPSAPASSSSRPGGIHTFRDLAAAGRGGAGGSSSGSGGNRIRTFRDLAGGNDAPSFPGMGGGGGGGGGAGFPGLGGAFAGGHAHDSDADDDDDEPMDDPVNFYTGGERSGLSVQNPDHLRRRAPAPNDLVGNILKQAAEAGARGAGGDAEAGALGASGSASASQSFAGTGRTLTGPSADEPQATAGDDATAGAQGDAAAEETELPTAIRYLTFWANGYTLSDEGPLRSYDDPQDAAVLRAIEAQRAPLDVLGVQPNQPVELRVAKKLGERWSPPPPGPARAFEGTGQRLGAPIPGDVGPSSSASSSGAATGSSSSTGATQAGPSAAAVHTDFEIDRSQPTTQIQVRLAEGGERIVATLNHTHTVGDLRRYINASRPGMSERPYTLSANFPPKPLPSDESTTIKDAGLLSAVVIQRWA